MVAEIEERIRKAAETVVAEPRPEPDWAREEVYTDADAPTPWTRLDEPDPHRA